MLSFCIILKRTSLNFDIFRGFRKIVKSDYYSFISAHLLVCPSVADFNEIRYLWTFRKYVETIQLSIKSYKNNRHFTGIPIHIYGHISLNSSYNEKCLRKKKSCTENRNIHFLFNNPPFFFKNNFRL